MKNLECTYEATNIDADMVGHEIDIVKAESKQVQMIMSVRYVVPVTLALNAYNVASRDASLPPDHAIFLRTAISRIRPRSHQTWHMIVPLSFLHIKFNLNLRPKALHPSLLVPRPNLELNAERDFGTLLKFIHNLGQCVGCLRFPILNATIRIGYSREGVYWLQCERLLGLYRAKERESGLERSGRSAIDSIQNVTGYWRGHPWY